jgi:single-strand DNA-binding protein
MKCPICSKEAVAFTLEIRRKSLYNKIILIGKLTRDPELKYTPQGTPVTTFRIAVNSRLSQEKQETLFIDVVAFGRVAETSNEYLTKGSSVLVEGRLHERRLEVDGQSRIKYEVLANTVRFLLKKEKDSREAPEEMTEEAPF